MNYCPQCGSVVNGTTFCNSCGYQLEAPAKGSTGSVSKTRTLYKNRTFGEKPPKYFPPPINYPPEKRDPLLWTIISTIPGISLLYIYYNFEDYRKMIRYYHGNDRQDVQDPALMLILMIVFPILPFYFKFQQLHDHFKLTHNEDSDVINGVQYLLIVIFVPMTIIIMGVLLAALTGVIAFSLIILIFIGYIVYILKLNYDWQVAFNEHIENHMKFTMNNEQLVKNQAF